MDVLTPLLLGFGRETLTTAVGAIGGLVSLVVVLAVVGLALAPQVSSRWAENLGVAEQAGGPDPAEVVPGFQDPVTPDGALSEGSQDGAVADTGADADAGTDAPSVAADAAE